MAFFDDLITAVNNYPQTNVTLSIVDMVVLPGGGVGTSVNVNVNELWHFRVNVANNGRLNMTGVTVHIEGLNGAKVSSNSAGPYSNLIIAEFPTLNAHDTAGTLNRFFKAPAVVKPAGTLLIRARISTFHINLDDILSDEQVPTALTPSGTFKAQVFL